MGHTERTHALLSASKAEQWINCPPSARLQEGIPDRQSEYANEGTLAHELAEMKLRIRLLAYDESERKRIDKRLLEIRAHEFYSEDMELIIQDYTEFVEEKFLEAKSRSSDAVILLEESLNFSEWVPEGYGTGDVVLISDGVLEIIDLKYGKGVPVSAIGNPQIRLYALGAWSEYGYLYDIREVQMTIVQPRLDNISANRMTVEELVEWAETVVKPAAAMAYSGDGEFNPGDHCRWCKVKATCRARAAENMKALAYEFRDPNLLTNEEIGQILFIADKLKAWVKDVEEYALGQAMAGEKVPGWKVVEGRSTRKITDEFEAIRRLFDLGYEPDAIAPRALLGISKLEKLLGKKLFTQLLGELVEKPPGKPTLVPETDRRPELNSLEADFENINFEEE